MDNTAKIVKNMQHNGFYEQASCNIKMCGLSLARLDGSSFRHSASVCDYKKLIVSITKM
jgi:hypothetical protein